MAQRFEFYRGSNGVWQHAWMADDGSMIQQSEGWTAGGYLAAPAKNRRLIQGNIAPEKRQVVTPDSDMVRVIGTDFGSSAMPALSWFEKARESYEGCWVPTGAWSPTPGAFWWRTIEVLEKYEQAGFEYFLTYHRPNRQVLNAWNSLGAWKQKISAFCFDVEDPADKLTPAAVDEVAQKMVADGVEPNDRLWLYSSYYMWQSVQGDADVRFKDKFKHISPYDGVKAGWPTSIPPIKLFGGFSQTQVGGLQIRGAEPSNYQYLDGIAHHENIFERTLLAL